MQQLVVLPTEKSTVRGLGLSAGGLVLVWIMVVTFYWQLPPEIPLFYSLLTGELQLADKMWFWLVPAMVTILGLINLLFIRMAQRLHVIAQQMIAWLTVLMVFMSMVAMFYVIILVF